MFVSLPFRLANRLLLIGAASGRASSWAAGQCVGHVHGSWMLLLCAGSGVASAAPHECRSAHCLHESDLTGSFSSILGITADAASGSRPHIPGNLFHFTTAMRWTGGAHRLQRQSVGAL